MDNRFEDMYGRLFRSYAKSIVEEIGRVVNSDNQNILNPNLLTVGVLQYRSYDNVFHYAPTLKNVFVFPDDIIMSGNFPTHNNDLWNYKLMVSLAKFFYSKRKNKWIEDIFCENEDLERNNASIFASLLPYYSEFRNKWKDWFLLHIDKFNDISEEDTLILNQLFYFANYLISIVKWSAYARKDFHESNSNAQKINTYVRLHKDADNGNEIFDPRGACIENGAHMRWYNQASSTVHKSSLLFVLEVCFKQPFNVDKKIKIIDDIRDTNSTDSISFINAVAEPLFKSGEFLGICYITWASEDENISKATYKEIKDKIKKVLDNSKISSLLYKERISAAKFYLRKIDSNHDIEKSTIQKVFDFAPVFSSAPIMACIEGDNLCIKFLKRHDIYFGYEKKDLDGTRKNKVLLALSEIAKISVDDLINNPVLWIDIVKDITHETCYNDIKNDITSFNKIIEDIISEGGDFNSELFYQITDITVHNFDKKGEKTCLIFFNSDFHQLFTNVSHFITS